MFFDYLNPDDTRPELLVDREEIAAWLKNGFASYIKLCGADDQPDPPPRVFGLIGEKGIGKSIVAQRVFHELREDWSARTVFLDVDCRPQRNSREVVGAIAMKAQDELLSLQRVDSQLPKGLSEAAGILVELTRYDSMESKHIHETLLRFKSAVSFEATKGFLSILNVRFGISLEREKKDIAVLEGQINFDLPRLIQLLSAFFDDVRAAGLSVLLLLDNFDELDHRYREDRRREILRDETQLILKLRHAPIGLLFCMRDYYCGIIPRDVTNHERLAALTKEQLDVMLSRRLEEEKEETRRQVRTGESNQALRQLTEMGATPLAFLMWFKFVAERDILSPARLASHAHKYVDSHWGSVEKGVIVRLIDAVAAKGGGNPRFPLSREEVLEAVNQSEALLEQLQDRQVILPRDFWHPVQFTLDPELHWLFYTLHPTNS